ncbi:N-acetylmuramidase family protein [Alsobacter sp. KACC 23698]|uniref:N-acetylmuramidase family protein n=1 Tax=Alsobacter sp. KACC 23698 TaxID=3149229 RepID=A0AAU7JMU8_9HYPH
MVQFTGQATRLTDSDIARAAELLGCDVPAIRAIIEIETRGSGFDRRGRLKALFEPHRFYAELGAGPKRAAAIKAGLAYPKWGQKPYPADSYARIVQALTIDETAALSATSWGLPQMMGSNCKLAGYATPQKMIAAFVDGEGAQLVAMAKFMKAAKLDGALRDLDWATFARGYNGPGYAKNGYHTKLAAAYDRFVEEFASAPATLVDLAGDAEDGDDDPGFHPVQDDEAGPSAVVAGVYPRAVIEAAQKQLCEMGYFDVGKIDGNAGGKTAGAVAGFMIDRGFGASGEINDDSLAEIGKAQAEGFRRPIAEARATASTKEVAAQVPAARRAWILQQWTRFTTWFMGGGAVTAFGASQTEQGKSFLGAFAHVPGYVWLAILFGGGFLAYRVVNLVLAAQVHDYQTGKRA